MQGGKLRHRISIEKPFKTRDADGQNIPFYVPVLSVWGSIKQLSGKQIAMASAKTITTTATHEIRMRYNPSLELQIGFHRLRREGITNRAFAINQIVNVDEKNAELVLTVTEVKA